MKKSAFWSSFFLCAVQISAQEYSARIDSTANYNSWGWTAVVQENDLVTIATVPSIGARIMQYCLGEAESIYRDSNMFGKTYTPAQGGLHSFGGFKNWPAPQARWNWPPPPTLDYGAYEADILIDTPDSTVLFVRSPVEKWLTPNLRFERKSTIYKGSSRVRVDQTLINEGASVQNWSVWDITQSVVHHASQTDYSNFWVYFTLNPNSRYGDEGIYWGSSWGEPTSIQYGEVAPGIFGLQYNRDEAKVHADSPEGWICVVDERDGLAFAKFFDLFEGAEYPDDGAHVEVYTTGNGGYMEIEVVGPIVALDPSGGRTTFTETWGAATVHGPILGVNFSGMIASRLAKDETTGRITGTYGVFHVGAARLVAKDSGGAVLSEGAESPVTPLATYQLDETFEIPSGAETVEVVLSNAAGEEIGVLDAASAEGLTSVSEQPENLPATAMLMPAYPNPFNPTTTLSFSLPREEAIRLVLFDVTGKEAAVIANGKYAAGFHSVTWDASAHAAGVYVARLATESGMKTQKLMLVP